MTLCIDSHLLRQGLVAIAAPLLVLSATLPTVATAEGAAKARTIQAKAEADANRIVAASITPELIRLSIGIV
mgnify:CR=1 FL=1